MQEPMTEPLPEGVYNVVFKEQRGHQIVWIIADGPHKGKELLTSKRLWWKTEVKHAGGGGANA